MFHLRMRLHDDESIIDVEISVLRCTENYTTYIDKNGEGHCIKNGNIAHFTAENIIEKGSG